MTIWEFFLGTGIALVVIAAAAFIAFRPSRHDIRSNGDYAEDGRLSNRHFDDFGDGGGGSD